MIAYPLAITSGTRSGTPSGLDRVSIARTRPRFRSLAYFLPSPSVSTRASAMGVGR